MATIAEQLTSLANTKTAIKEAIVAKGVAVADTDPFSTYSAKIGQISGGGETTKFGVSIDNILGNVDENGKLSAPTEPFVLDLSGVRSVGAYALGGAFERGAIQEIIADDIVEIEQYGFYAAFQNVFSLEKASFNGLIEISSKNAFANAFQNARNAVVVYGSLKRISGKEAFYYTFSNNYNFVPDDTFPVLEEITGSAAFSSAFGVTQNKPIQFSSVKKIVGGSTAGTATFNLFTANQIWKFPNATDFSGYIFRNYVSEIHFAAANQTAIEACEGYDYKWGASDATIYFDLWG